MMRNRPDALSPEAIAVGKRLVPTPPLAGIQQREPWRAVEKLRATRRAREEAQERTRWERTKALREEEAQKAFERRQQFAQQADEREKARAQEQARLKKEAAGEKARLKTETDEQAAQIFLARGGPETLARYVREGVMTPSAAESRYFQETGRKLAEAEAGRERRAEEAEAETETAQEAQRARVILARMIRDPRYRGLPQEQLWEEARVQARKALPAPPETKEERLLARARDTALSEKIRDEAAKQLGLEIAKKPTLMERAQATEYLAERRGAALMRGLRGAGEPGALAPRPVEPVAPPEAQGMIQTKAAEFKQMPAAQQADALKLLRETIAQLTASGEDVQNEQALLDAIQR
jgi:hypothetical protein